MIRVSDWMDRVCTVESSLVNSKVNWARESSGSTFNLTVVTPIAPSESVRFVFWLSSSSSKRKQAVHKSKSGRTLLILWINNPYRTTVNIPPIRYNDPSNPIMGEPDRTSIPISPDHFKVPSPPSIA